MAEALSPMRRSILEFIASYQREKDYPPTIREIGSAVGLSSSATVKNHIEVLKTAGYLVGQSGQARTLTVRFESDDAPKATVTSIRQIPYVGDVAAGTGVLATEHDHELMEIPEQFAGRHDSFVLKVRGDSMIEAGILPGDFVVVQRQDTADKGSIVVAGIPGDEATIKRYFPQGARVVLKPENSSMEPMEFDAADVHLFGRVISVLRSY
jgi:repressor LexA